MEMFGYNPARYKNGDNGDSISEFGIECDLQGD